jgi:peptidoglycan/LPS O-acetylase OafA/YrhL
LSWFARPSRSTLVLAAACLVVDLVVADVPNLESRSALHLAAWTATAWFVARAAVAATATLTFATSPVVRRLGDWTMPIYLLHHPWSLAFSLLLLPTRWPAELQFVTVTLLTLAATWASCLVVSRSTVAALLLNGRPLSPLTLRPRPAPPLAASATV